ncbi:MAG: peptide ABC transporter substrate-binding protein, partial [Gammaproteobacteria bacterium]|nr:peptide ABC transporter substrate-binding protein [Gammaproteobacteria bacterium]
MTRIRMHRRDFLTSSLAGTLAASVGLSPAVQAQTRASSVLRRVVASELTSLDPQRPTGQVTAEIAAELFAGLAVTDAAGRIVPGCANSWSTSADGRTWTFKLRKGLAWSDGKPLDARDFVFTLRRYLAPE